ncbi:hypothetical protein I5W30_04775 [Stenotrophomonas maltophilia]|nr:hypothetical protein [Stenotrophomonas maltophilia]
MASYEWLNEIPEEEWDKHDSGFSKYFDWDGFIQKCGLPDDGSWQVGFDEWGRNQPRRYAMFVAPGGRLLIAWGDWHVKGA